MSTENSMHRILTALVLAPAFSLALAAEPWGSVGGYLPGMSKDAAKKVGLQSCEPKEGSLICAPLAPITIGATSAEKTRLIFDRRTGVLKQVRVYFAPNTAWAALDAALDRAYGKKEILFDDKDCSGFKYDVGSDVIVEACDQNYYGKTVVFTYYPGRAAGVKRYAAVKARQAAKASDFDTK